MLDKITNIITHILLFLMLVISVNNYADFVLFVTILSLLILLIFNLIRCHKKVIPKEILIFNILSVICQSFMIFVLKKLNIWHPSNGSFGLGGGQIGTLFYICIFVINSTIYMVIGIIKHLIRRRNKNEK